MHECIPLILHSSVPIPKIHIEEYFHEHIVVEHVDCHQAYIGRVSVCSGHCTDGIRRSRVAVLDLTLPGGVKNDCLSRDLRVRNQSESTSGGCKAIMTGRS